MIRPRLYRLALATLLLPTLLPSASAAAARLNSPGTDALSMLATSGIGRTSLHAPDDAPGTDGASHLRGGDQGNQDKANGAGGDTASETAVPSKQDNNKPLPASAIKHPVLWHPQGNISELDLYDGAGGKKHLPSPPFTFQDEDSGGTNPKFDVTDANGKSWHCKVGEETRPEVVASRLLWAVGFYANEDYLVPNSKIAGMKMHRGDKETKKGNIRNARFERKPDGEKKIGIWEWKQNPFFGTREFNGLRVMMTVMNNWDLKDENNSVYSDKKTGEQIFLVNDVGAVFGSNGLGFTRSRSKGNVDSYKKSKFIQNVSNGQVSFATPQAPTKVLLATAGVSAFSWSMRSGLTWIGQNIPVEDARWMGSLLGQLTHQQLVDAFRAGNFPKKEIDTYVSVVESRIAKLKSL